MKVDLSRKINHEKLFINYSRKRELSIMSRDPLQTNNAKLNGIDNERPSKKTTIISIQEKESLNVLKRDLRLEDDEIVDSELSPQSNPILQKIVSPSRVAIKSTPPSVEKKNKKNNNNNKQKTPVKKYNEIIFQTKQQDKPSKDDPIMNNKDVIIIETRNKRNSIDMGFIYDDDDEGSQIKSPSESSPIINITRDDKKEIKSHYNKEEEEEDDDDNADDENLTQLCDLKGKNAEGFVDLVNDNDNSVINKGTQFFFLGQEFSIDREREIKVLKILFSYFQNTCPITNFPISIEEVKGSSQEMKKRVKIEEKIATTLMTYDERLTISNIDDFLNAAMSKWDFYDNSNMCFIQISVVQTIFKGLRSSMQSNKQMLLKMINEDNSKIFKDNTNIDKSPEKIKTLTSFDICSIFALAFMNTERGKRKFSLYGNDKKSLWGKLKQSKTFSNLILKDDTLEQVVNELSEKKNFSQQYSHWKLVVFIGFEIRRKYLAWLDSFAKEGREYNGEAFLCLVPVFSEYTYKNLYDLILAQDKIVIGNNSHFTLLVFEIRKEKSAQSSSSSKVLISHKYQVTHFDSMCKFSSMGILNDYINTIDFCLGYGGIYRKKEVTPKMVNFGWQLDGYNCGYYACFFILLIISNIKNNEILRDGKVGKSLIIKKFLALKEMIILLMGKRNPLKN